MKMYILRILKCICLLASAEFCSCNNDNTNCPVEHCNNKHGPEIRFPFSLKGKKYPHQCVYPSSNGFELYCSDHGNLTLLDIPFPTLNSSSFNLANLTCSVDLIVKEIDYASQHIVLSLADANCSDGDTLLDLSATPFTSSDYCSEGCIFESIDYTFFNCSTVSSAWGYMYSLPCLGGSSDHVYAIQSDASLSRVSPYCSGKMFDALLSSSSLIPSFSDFLWYWSTPNCRLCEIQGRSCRLKNNGVTALDTECFAKVFPASAIKDSKKEVTEGLVISSSAIAALVMILYLIHTFNKKKGEKRIRQFLEDHKALRPTRFTYADIKKITSHFKEKLGQGGYGTVYKGKLSTDILVAVKVLDNFKGNGEEFINEVRTIGKIHHVNVVRLVGFCADGYRRCLVYEFLPNQSLQKLISSENQIRVLGWEKLQQIAIDIAKGIEYLHQGCNQRILHFDIKPHNILLDKNFNPKVADFGLAKLCSKEKSMVSMTAARGTVGYIAPEVFSRNYGHVSYKADIYSFGMLLLDMVGGRKNFRAAGDDNSSEVYFPEWMYNQLEKGEEIAIRIEKEEDDKVIKKLTVAGLWCIQWYPVDRPTMKDVIQMIEGDDVPTMPPNPFASTKITTSAANASTSRFNFNTTLEIISEGD